MVAFQVFVGSNDHHAIPKKKKRKKQTNPRMKLMYSLYNFYRPITMFLDYLENCENHCSLCHWCMSKKWSGPIDFFGCYKDDSLLIWCLCFLLMLWWFLYALNIMFVISFLKMFLSNKNCDLQFIYFIVFNFLMLHQKWQSATRIFSQICLQDK
jgi:hypothetical protein